MKDTAFNDLKMISFDNYLARPKILGGENLGGFIYRFYDANGVQVPREIWRFISSLSRTETEAKLTHELLKFLVAAGINLSEYDFWNHYLLLKKRKNLKSNNLAQHRFCPACLNEKSFHCSLWDLPMFVACPLHGCKLAYYCEHCKLPFDFITLLADWKCRCEYDLKESNIQPASESEIRISKVILNATDIPKTSIYLEHTDQEKPNKYTLNEFYDVLEWTSNFRKNIKIFGIRKLSKFTPHSNWWSLGYTEYKFLLKRPTYRQIQKLLKKLSIQNKPFIGFLNRFSDFNVISKELAYLIAHDTPFTRNLIPIFQIFKKEYLNQLQLEFTAYLNTPRLTISKPFCLLQFNEWWKQVIHLTEKFKNTANNNEAKIINFRGYIEDVIEAIFRHLIQASQIEGSDMVYASLLKGWEIPEILNPRCGVENILVNLKSIHPYDLLVFYNLLGLADQSIE